MDSIVHDETWLETLSAYVDGECSRQELAAVRRHLPACPECREWLSQVGADRARLRASLTSSAQGIDLTGRVMEEVFGMPTPEKPQEDVPIALAGRPGFAATAVRHFILVEAVVVAVILVIPAGVLFPVFARARERARHSSCMSNIRQIGLGALMHAQDHYGRLPDTRKWPDQLEPYVHIGGSTGAPVTRRVPRSRMP